MLKRRFSRVLVAALLLVSMLVQGTWVLAGTTGGLSGTLVDTVKGAPIAGASVTVSSPSQTVSTTSNDQGKFTFLSLAPDTYTVSVEKKGYEPTSVSGISIFADSTQTVTVKAQPQLKEIGRVSTKASSDLVKPGTTSDVYSVSAAQQQVAQSLGGGGSMNQAYSGIASVPGVYVPQGQSGWAQSVYIRGGNYTQLGYEFDGVPVQRAFDQYPSTTLSTLGQQELQVYTGSGPVSSQSSGLAGFINQVIKTGSYPGFGNVDLGIGSPTLYNSVKFEVGGATTNRNFSYYVGLSGYNQNFRYYDNYNGASLDGPYGTPYNAVAANCGAQNATAGCYANGDGYLGLPLAPNGIANGPWVFATNSGIADRETIVNLHFGIPHKDGSGKDDVQVLYSNSLLTSTFQESQNDWTYASQDVINGTAHIGGTFYDNCDNVASGPCAIIGPNQQAYLDRSIYTGPVGGALTAANLGQTQQYLFPSSSPLRAVGANIDPSMRDNTVNESSVLKLQYQKNIGSSAYFRIYGYTMYSDWLQYGPNSTVINFAGSVSPDYELITHTRGLSFTFADQISAKHLLNLTGGYTYANTVRWNNGFYSAPRAVALAVDSTNPTSGTCYSVAGGAGTPTSCFGTPSAYRLSGTDAVTGALAPQGTSPTVDTIGSNTCGGGPCEYLVVNNGVSGTYNTVAPKFSNISLDDQFRPSDKWLVNLGVHFDRFSYGLSDTTTPAGPLPQAASAVASTFWTNAWIATNCQNTADLTLVSKSPTAACPDGTVPVTFSNTSPSSQTYNEFEPRIAATYTVNPLNVLRFSWGKYAQPASSAYQQYNNASPQIAAKDAIFYPIGFRTPAHAIYPEESFNTDLSWESQMKGTDVSFKATPFYRTTKNEIYQVLLDPKTNFVSGINVGKKTVDGIELEVRKGDFSRNGFAGQLAFTYTYGTVKFSALPNGQTVLGGVNSSIKQYNGYTSYCASNPNDSRCGKTSTGVAAAPCYASDGSPDPSCAAGSIANPYWNAPVQKLFDNNASYVPYNQLPGTGLSSVSSSYIIPYVATLLLQYKKDKWTFTPTFQFSGGGKYGSPVQGAGIDPAAGCSGTLSGATAGDPRYPYGAAGGSPYDAQTCSATMVTPNAYSGQFDNFGAYTEPSSLVANLQIGYEPTPKVKLTATMVNVVTTCFGGTKNAWTNAGPRAGCWYGSPGAYVGNVYNPGNEFQTAYQYPYAPTFGNVFQSAYGGQTNPMQIFLQASFKL